MVWSQRVKIEAETSPLGSPDDTKGTLCRENKNDE